jgi:poly(hydroxyalkanoate) depolymerase family esterase
MSNLPPLLSCRATSKKSLALLLLMLSCTPSSHREPVDSVLGHAAPLVVTARTGSLGYRLFVPSSYVAGRPLPLILALHGCTQSGESFAASTRLDSLAEAEGFLVAYPDQPTSASFVKCWNWFDPNHQVRGRGEPAALAGVVEHVATAYTVEREQVYVAGFSAGAAMAVILGATYPDVFAAIAVGSGLEYRAGTDAGSGSTAMRSGGPSPKSQGELAYRAMGSYRRVVPTIVVHGSADSTVAPINAEQVVSQWAETNDLASDGVSDDNIDDRADVTEAKTAAGGRRYTWAQYLHRSGAELVLERVLIDGMNHAWSGPGTGSYTDNKGPNQSELVWQFFRRFRKSGAAPSVDGGVVVDSGTVVDGGAVDGGGVVDSGGVVDGGAVPDAADVVLELLSLDREDGTVGSLPVDAPTASVLKTGDKGLFGSDQLRGVLSFDTAALPAGRTPKRVTLVLTRKAAQGAVTTVVIDGRRGVFGSKPDLQSEDFSAAATQLSAATFSPPSSDGATIEVSLPVSLFAAGAPSNRVQLRLRAVTPIDFATDQLTFFDGAAAAQAPRLTLRY